MRTRKQIESDELLWERYASLRNLNRLSSTDFKFARGVFLDGLSWERAEWEASD